MPGTGIDSMVQAVSDLEAYDTLRTARNAISHNHPGERIVNALQGRSLSVTRFTRPTARQGAYR
jgi:hypothetical protein